MSERQRGKNGCQKPLAVVSDNRVRAADFLTKAGPIQSSLLNETLFVATGEKFCAIALAVVRSSARIHDAVDVQDLVAVPITRQVVNLGCHRLESLAGQPRGSQTARSRLHNTIYCADRIPIVIDSRTALSCLALIGFELRRFAIEAHVRWMIAGSSDDLHPSFSDLAQYLVLSLARVKDNLVNAPAREHTGALRDVVARALRAYRANWNDDSRQEFVAVRDSAEQDHLGDWCEKQSPLHSPEWQSLIRAAEDVKQSMPRPLAIAFQLGLAHCDAVYIDDSTPEGMPLLGTEAFPIARRDQLLAELRDCLASYPGDFFRQDANLELSPRQDGSRWAESLLTRIASITEAVPESARQEDASARPLPDPINVAATERTVDLAVAEVQDEQKSERTAPSASRRRGSNSPPGTKTTAEVAQQLAVDPGKVLDWIHSGQLVAVNVATNTGGRPRWRVSQESLAEFLARRKSQLPPSTRSRRKPKSDVIEFY